MKILNIGCGRKQIKGAINIDSDLFHLPDKCVDMEILPWEYANESIDKIIMHHFLEHTKDPKSILKECQRVLKQRGELDITVPHSSCAGAVGCLNHYRTFSYNSLKDYLDHTLMETTHQRIVWLPHFEWVPIQWLIDLSPIFFERFWCYYVGGATQVEWKGKKRYY